MLNIRFIFSNYRIWWNNDRQYDTCSRRWPIEWPHHRR